MGLISRVSSRTYRLNQKKMSSDKGTNWMYESQTELDTEAYLTGKKIDKAFEKFLDAQLKTERENRLAGVTTTGEKEADLYNKKLEDPLTVIKNHEKSAKERLKANPKKLKVLRDIFNQMMEEKVSDKKRAKGIKREAKRKRKYEDRGKSNDDESRDEDTFDKYRRENKMTRDVAYNKDNEIWNAERYKVSYSNRLIYGYRDERYTDKERAGEYYNGNIDRSEKQKSRDDDKDIKAPKFESIKRYEKVRRGEKDSRGSKPDKKEREARLAAMMSDAKTFESKRKEKSIKLDKMQKKQHDEDRKNLGKGSGFMRDFKNNCGNASLEDRINSRKHRQQRTSNDLSKNSF